MCYECKCLDPDFELSNFSITEETFKKAAEGAGITLEECKRNVYEMLKAELGE